MQTLVKPRPKPKQAALQKKRTAQHDFVHVQKVKPSDSMKVFIGRFDMTKAFKGFGVEFRPSTAPENSVIAHISRIGEGVNAKFFLEIANNGHRSVTARVHQL